MTIIFTVIEGVIFPFMPFMQYQMKLIFPTIHQIQRRDIRHTGTIDFRRSSYKKYQNIYQEFLNKFSNIFIFELQIFEQNSLFENKSRSKISAITVLPSLSGLPAVKMVGLHGLKISSLARDNLT